MANASRTRCADQVAIALREAGGNLTQAARTLGMTRYALRRLARKHGISARDGSTQDIFRLKYAP